MGASVNPRLILDRDFRVVAANSEYHRAFGTTPGTIESALSTMLNALKEARIDLRAGIEQMLVRADVAPPSFEWPDLAGNMRSLVLTVTQEIADAQRSFILVEDVTDQLDAMRKLGDLVEQDELLLQELRHRMANSLQIIASILRIKSHLIESSDGRSHLEDVHQRVLSIAALLDELDVSNGDKVHSVGHYLSAVCARLAASLIDPRMAIEIRVEAAPIEMRPDMIVSLGLVVTELVMNALKHGFEGLDSGLILVNLTSQDLSWTLSVTDNGVGCPRAGIQGTPGLGTRIIRALARRLNAQLEISATRPSGLTVGLTHQGRPNHPS